MGEVVLDTSAVLTAVLGERGSEEIQPLLAGGLISAVNLAETMGRLLEQGWQESEARVIPGKLNLIVVPFDPDDAWAAALLRRRTRSEGLSLADRACLALALSRGLTAVTMDRAWGRLGLGSTVRVIRR